MPLKINWSMKTQSISWFNIYAIIKVIFIIQSCNFNHAKTIKIWINLVYLRDFQYDQLHKS